MQGGRQRLFPSKKISGGPDGRHRSDKSSGCRIRPVQCDVPFTTCKKWAYGGLFHFMVAANVVEVGMSIEGSKPTQGNVFGGFSHSTWYKNQSRKLSSSARNCLTVVCERMVSWSYQSNGLTNTARGKHHLPVWRIREIERRRPGEADSAGKRRDFLSNDARETIQRRNR